MSEEVSELIFKEGLHFDLDFLEVGHHWRPPEDINRLKTYEFSRYEFELRPKNLIQKIFPNGILDLRNYNDFVECTRLLGYPRLLTLKTVDMVVGQPPIITAQSKDNFNDIIRDLRASTQLNSAFKRGLIDYSRFGVLLLRVFKDEQGKAAITAWNPNEWTPVFYPDGTQRIHYNVLGWKHDDKLFLQIHDTSDGSYEERICKIDSSDDIVEIISRKKYNEGTDKKLFFAVINTPTTTNPLGTNDYEIINGLLQKAIERLQAILRVLDEHADPSMMGPHTLLSKTENGETVFKTSKYYAIGDDEKEPKYLVWDANLDSSFKAFELLCKQIFTLSEMGEAFIGASEGTGNVVSGAAMRYKMISPLEKARRIGNDLTEPLKEIISSMLSIEGHDLPAKEINISWRDSLPKDPREIAELAKLESGATAIKPINHALMDNYELDKETADHYVDEILKYQELFNKIAGKAQENIMAENDGRSHGAGATEDSRKKGSILEPHRDKDMRDRHNESISEDDKKSMENKN